MDINPNDVLISTVASLAGTAAFIFVRYYLMKHAWVEAPSFLKFVVTIAVITTSSTVLFNIKPLFDISDLKKRLDTLRSATNTRESNSDIFETRKISSRKDLNVPPKSASPQIVKGKSAYHIPDSMAVDTMYTITYIASQSLLESILFYELERSQFVTSMIPLSSRLAVVLADPERNNFEIMNMATAEQMVDDSTSTKWSWTVKPLKGGKHPIAIKASIRIFDRFGGAVRDVQIIQEEINVTGSWLYTTHNFLAQQWEYCLTTLLIPIFVLARKRSYTTWKTYQTKRQKAKRIPAGFPRAGC